MLVLLEESSSGGWLGDCPVVSFSCPDNMDDGASFVAQDDDAATCGESVGVPVQGLDKVGSTFEVGDEVWLLEVDEDGSFL